MQEMKNYKTRFLIKSGEGGWDTWVSELSY